MPVWGVAAGFATAALPTPVVHYRPTRGRRDEREEQDIAAARGTSDGGGTSFEDTIIDAFVELADTLTAGHDVADFLHRLLTHAIQLLEAEAGGVLLHHEGRLRVIASSSEDMGTLELFELQNDEGPCMDAYRAGDTVVADDLEHHRDRWPLFVPQALEHGWRSALAVPLRLRDERIGALNLLSTAPQVLGERSIRIIRGLADVAAIGILQERAISDRELTARQLQHALDSRVRIEQAKGRIAEQHDGDVDEAFRLLRSHARSHNLRLADVAAAVVDGELAAGDLAAARPPPEETDS